MKNQIIEQDVSELLFYLENQSKKDFKRWLTGVNIFEVLKISSAEIRHSNILGWLISPNENHGLKDKFFEKFMLKVFDDKRNDVKEISSIEVLLNDFSDAKVFRETKNNIDILFSSEKNKFNLIIENKTGTVDHDDQLARYREYIEKEYPDYNNLYVYLTPFGDEPVEADENEKSYWKLISYKAVSEILDDLVSEDDVDEKVKYILKEYNDNLKRNILSDEELSKISAEIYYKHKEVLDLIMNNLPDKTEDLKREFLEALHDLARERRIIFDDCDLDVNRRGNRGFFRFRTKFLDDFLENQVSQGVTSWDSGSQYYYEIEIKPDSIADNTYVTLSEKNTEEQSQSAERVKFIKKKLEGGHWGYRNEYFVMRDFPKIGKTYDEMRDDLGGEIRSYLNKILKEIAIFEKELSEKWTEQNQEN